MKINIKKMMLLALMLLPFESIPHVLPSIYRPITVYPLCIMGVIYVIKNIRQKKIDRIDLDFLLFGSYAIISGIILSCLKFNSLNAFMDFLLTFILGIFSFFGANYGFQKFRQYENTNEEYIYMVFSFLSKVYTFVLIIGIVELLCEIGVLPFVIIKGIYTFSGGGQYNRVCLFSSEAAYASNHLILMMILFYFMFQKTKKNKYALYLCMTLIIFIYNMSGMGLINVVSLTVIYLFVAFFLANNKKNAKFGIALVSILFIGYYVIQLVLPHMTGSYYVSRIKDFTNIDNLIHKEGSSFIRLVYPYLALLVFGENVFFGIGAGNFCNVLEYKLKQHYPWAILKYDEVYAHVHLHVEQTGCLYTRLLAETGIIGCILYLKPIFKVVRKVKYVYDKQFINIILVIISFLFTLILQIDSFVYEMFWVMLAFVNNLTKERQA